MTGTTGIAAVLARILGLAAVLLIVVPAAAQVPLMGGASDTPAAAEPGPSLQQVLDGLPKPLTAEQVDSILAVLDDNQARAALRESVLRQMVEGQSAVSRETLLEQHKRRVADVGAAFRDLPVQIREALYRPDSNGETSDPVLLFLILAGHILVGTVAMLLTRRALSNTCNSLMSHKDGSFGQSMGRCAAVMVIDLVEIGAFCLAIIAVYLVGSPTEPRAPLILEALLIATAGTLLAAKVSRTVLAPTAPALRLVPLSDAGARRLHRIVVVVFGSMLTLNFLVTLLAILGLPRDAQIATGMLLGALFCAYLIVLVWANRAPVSAALSRSFGGGSQAAQIAGLWPVAGTAYVVGLWLVATDAEIRGNDKVTPQAMASLAIVILVPVLAHFADRLLRRFFAEPPRPVAAIATAGEGEGGPTPALSTSQPVNLTALMRGVWIFLVIVAAGMTARIWGFDPTESAGLGAAAVRVLFESSFIVLASYIGWQLFRTAVDRKLVEANQADATTQAKRMATLLPLLRKFILVVLLVMITLIVLSSLGIEIGPLLAGAGVVGLAIGLGAQSLVTDIVAGVFFLIDDAFSVGDYIEVGQLRGTVESISIRSLKLRHHRGAVHTLPFGQMQSLTNYSRDWVIMKLEFRVPHDTDIGLVKKLVKRIGAEMGEDPIYGADFLEPLKSQGVRRIEDNALIIGVKFMSKPGTQFVIRKDAYQRIRDAFEANGIEFANRGVTVRVETDSGAAAAAASTAVAGAAAEAIAEAGQEQAEAAPADCQGRRTIRWVASWSHPDGLLAALAIGLCRASRSGEYRRDSAVGKRPFRRRRYPAAA
ncbi:MAG: mechanosensitive ion channel family protein [Inquilinus sp.]|nr:mechanosensitive ion channel family protein [Inquilinus sp.]